MECLTGRRSDRLLTVICLLFSAHFAIAYETLTVPMVPFDPHRNLVGDGGPFAYRMLPLLVWRACAFLIRPLVAIFPRLRWPILHRPFASNEEWFIVLLTFLAMFGTLQSSRRLLRSIAGGSRAEAFEWIALGMVYAAYFNTILVLNRNLYYPYDILALFLFTWLVELAYRQRPAGFLVVLVVAMLNKETAIMSVLIYFGLNFQHSRAGRRKSLRVLAISGGALAAAVAVRLAQTSYIQRRCHTCSPQIENQFTENLHQLVNPLFWMSEVAVFGFAYVAAVVLWRYVPITIRVTSIAVGSLWIGAMFMAGVLRELRIFSELSPLLLLAVGTGLQGWLTARNTVDSVSAGVIATT